MGRPLKRGAQEKTFHEERHENQLSEDRNWKWEDREDAAPRKMNLICLNAEEGQLQRSTSIGNLRGYTRGGRARFHGMMRQQC
jgi:hypothetical protein